MEPMGVILAEEDISRLLMSYLKSKRLIGAMVALEDETGPDPALCDLTSEHTPSRNKTVSEFSLHTPDFFWLLGNRCYEAFSLKMRN
jgi:hypothetical protein